jgi:protein tyrosine phosphatase (PTP) superfamily phosphohydrolase (DUF442 family)
MKAYSTSAAAVVICLACVTSSPDARADEDAAAKASDQQTSPRKLDVDDFHNAWEVMPGVLSGEQPHGKQAFAALADLGVKTIVSVDGARPAVELARARGIRYVHIPIGYDGLGETATASLARVARECERPIYVHCHHGKHRGPAAAVVLSMSDPDSDFDVADAVGAMQIIGTSPDYRGLWREVREYESPADGGVLSESSLFPALVEVAEVDDLPSAMARLDRAWDRVVSCQKVGWQFSPDHPDITPSHEALLLLEALKESGRIVEVATDESTPDLREGIAQATAHAASLRKAIAVGDRERAGKLIDGLRKSCHDCHEKARN